MFCTKLYMLKYSEFLNTKNMQKLHFVTNLNLRSTKSTDSNRPITKFALR